MNIAIAVLQGAAFVAGLLILFYTLFSYEDEEKKVKSWFDAAWLALKNKDESIGQRIASFLRMLLNGLNSVFTRMYGQKLVSFRAIAAGICYAAAVVSSTPLFLSTWEWATLIFVFL